MDRQTSRNSPVCPTGHSPIGSGADKGWSFSQKEKNAGVSLQVSNHMSLRKNGLNEFLSFVLLTSCEVVNLHILDNCHIRDNDGTFLA